VKLKKKNVTWDWEEDEVKKKKMKKGLERREKRDEGVKIECDTNKDHETM
jgi:hypothetical protein